ncbi:MAG: PAS domain-containing protein, partial [candidate division Zixibacteria bacterium]|nr:PAS domain-containing protein [candidate division Zixibacteria bacterium]
KALDALKESEERFRSIFENNTIGLYRTTPDGRVLMANVAIFEMLRVSSSEELYSRNLEKEGYPPDYSREWFRSSLERDGKIIGHEAEWKRSDGTTVFVRESARVVRDKMGEVLYYEGTVEDITEQKSVQETLRKSEERYRKLYTMVRLMCDNVPDMIWAKDLEKRYLFANKSLCQNLLRAEDTEEPIGKTDLYFVSRQQESNPKDDEWRSFGEMCSESDSIVMETRQPLRFDESGYVGNNYICLDVHKTPFLDENGEMIGTVGSARDVTLERQSEEERRKAELALRESEQRFREFATAVTDVIYRYDPVNNRYDFVSPSIETMLGIPVSEIIANPQQSAADMIHPDDVDRLISELDAHIAKGADAGSIDLEYRMIDEAGRVIWVNDRKVIEFTPEGKPYRINGVVSDITEKKRTEELLRRRDGILRSCGYFAELILKTEDFEWGINEGLMNLGKATGVSRVYIFENIVEDHELFARQLYEWVDEGIEPQIDNPALQNLSYDTSGARRLKHLLSQSEIAFGTLEELSADERAILELQDILSIAIVPIYVKQKWWGFVGFDDCRIARIWSVAELNVLKAAAGTIGAAFERKQNELALKESEERYTLAVRAGRTGVWDLTLGTERFSTYGNLQAHLGLSRDELPQTLNELLELIHPDDRELIQQAFFDHKEGKSELLKAEHRIIRPDGDSHWVLTQGKIIKNSKEEPIRMVGTTTDINEQKLAQEKLEASLSEKEVLLKEIYHRVKNNLQVISSLFDLQLNHIRDDKARSVIKTNQNRIGLMAIIHEQLYQSPDLSMISFPEYIRNLVMSLFESYGVDYDKVSFEVGGDDVYLSIDAAIPCGLIINELVTNSLKHAFPQEDRGVISIEISAIDDKYLLTVSDNGIGIPEHIDLKKSRSLGWQLISLLVDQLNGNIRKLPEKGATFRIEFMHIKPV